MALVKPQTKVSPSPVQSLIKDLRQRLAQQADAKRAAQQQAYMKSTMAYAGLTSPILHKLCNNLFSEHELTSAQQWYGCAEQLWDQATVREERYAALALLSINRYRKKWYNPDCLPIYRHMVETGAWWDYVDNIAANHVGSRQRFFARKAIGWALRAYSYTDPGWVIDYIQAHRTALSPLSIREGMKVIKRRESQARS